MIRLNKYMSEAGVCSRREADRLAEQGRVTVDGRKAVVGMQIEEGQQVALDGKPVEKDKKDRIILLAVNKPRGVVCSEVSQGNDVNIIEFLQYPKRITYVGRLDKDSEGLLLMTNRGDIINKMMRGSNCHEKEYEVVVDRPFNDRFLKDMAAGVYLHKLDVTTRPCQVERIGKKKFRIVLTQGLNRQIRRMCQEFGYHVQELKRVRIMNIRLGHLSTGNWRNVTGDELEELLSLLEESSNEPGGMQDFEDGGDVDE
ncbi:MAG: pseudouridine synthase [Clostridiales bacterium]|nr:pseudouridine synthase [Clostridiales bacterium]